MPFLILLIIICLFIGLFALAFILKIINVIFSPFLGLFNSSKKRASNSDRTQNTDDFQKNNNKKIFDDKEGEYVDFEEIDDRE